MAWGIHQQDIRRQTIKLSLLDREHSCCRFIWSRASTRYREHTPANTFGYYASDSIEWSWWSDLWMALLETRTRIRNDRTLFN
jgi:hypothetical protein